MADSPSKSRENVSTPVQSPESTAGRKVDAKETPNFGINYAEVIGDNVEGADAMGNVSETFREGDKKDLGGSSGGQAQAGQKFDPAQIRAQLLKKAPPPAIMKKQIEREIKKEINYLHSRAMKMLRNPGEANYFEMSNVMKKIRGLKFILAHLLKASLENLKTLWLRYVHGIM